MNFQKKIRLLVFSLIAISAFLLTPNYTFAANICQETASTGFIPCGQSCDNPSTPNNEEAVCTLCHLFLILQNITNWMLHSMTYLALAIIVAMGILYVVSTNNARISNIAGRGIWAALIGFAIALIGWIIINAILMILADGALGPGTATFSIKESRTGKWFEFNCSTQTKYTATTLTDGNPNTSTAEKACSLYTSSTTIPSGYGSPFNQLSSAKESTLGITCSDTGAIVTAGSVESNTYVYKTGFVSENGTWEPVNFSGTSAENNDGWLQGTATAYTSNTLSSGQNFITTFICQYNNGQWKCGCRDSACTQNYWTIQAYEN